MKFVALVSGGKDSFYSIMECIRNGHELVGCAHLSPRKQNPVDGEEEEESYMYQTAASECIPTLVEECLGVPLVLRECVGRSKNTSLVYDHQGEEKSKEIEDEVEDLYELLKEVQNRFPSVQGISSGAILSTYQRTRIESVCCRLGLTPLGYMWRIGPQRELLECMLKDGIEAVLVKVASPPGLMPQRHLNKTLGQLHYGGVFDRLKDRFDFHICGEGGEYETLVVDCPLFRKKLVLTDVEIIEGDDGVGVLKVNECCAVEKDSDAAIWEKSGAALFDRIQDEQDEAIDIDNVPSSSSQDDTNAQLLIIPRVINLPNIRVLNGGLAHVSEIISQQIFQASDLKNCPTDVDKEAELAVLEAKSIFHTFKEALKRIQWTNEQSSVSSDVIAATPQDVVFVHLYLSSISHFAKINKFYKEFFGTVLPPSRSCVAVGTHVLPGGRRVMMDCIIQRGSGEYMRINQDTTATSANPKILTNLSPCNEKFIKEHKNNPHHKLRSTLHVQTISHWAPICVGPYSQANTVRSGVIFMAGQIGLNPGTMTLIDNSWKHQLVQSWKNAASVLDALEGSLSDSICGVVYIGSNVAIDCCDGAKFSSLRSQVWDDCEALCRKSILSNGYIKAGYVDELKSPKSDELYGGFEDYETYKEVMGDDIVDAEGDGEAPGQNEENIPLLMVSIPEMPVGAISEVELVCATSRASSCLDMSTHLGWEKDSKSSTNKSQADGQMSMKTAGNINWDTGYDGISYDLGENSSTPNLNECVKIDSVVRSIGKGCAAVAFCTASFTGAQNDESFSVDWTSIIWDMMDDAIHSIEYSSGLGRNHVLNIRLFHTSYSGDDSLLVRNALNSVVGAEWGKRPKWGEGRQKCDTLPATSVIPVEAMYLSPRSHSSATHPFLAMQVTVTDLVHMESEMWIHHNRSNTAET